MNVAREYDKSENLWEADQSRLGGLTQADLLKDRLLTSEWDDQLLEPSDDLAACIAC